MNNHIFDLSILVQTGGYIKPNIETAIHLYKYNSTILVILYYCIRYDKSIILGKY